MHMKALASYYHVDVDGGVNFNAACFYPNLSAAAKLIEDYIANGKNKIV